MVEESAPQMNNPDVFQPDERMQQILRKQAEHPLTIDQFEGREGQVFRLIDLDAEVPLELVAAKRLPPQPGAPCQEPGSLIFETDATWKIPQRLYVVEHDDLGELVLFLVPTMGGKASPGATPRMRLQTVFN